MKRPAACLFLLAIVLLFAATRLPTMMSFPIFNDEANHIEYSQLIRADCGKYKFISCDNVFGDWKPPLMFWMGALVVDLLENPLVSVRVLSLLFSIAGILGIYHFARDLYDGTTGLCASLLFVLCPAVLIYNNQFTAETYVFSTAALYYSFCVKALLRPRQAVLFTPPAAITGAALLLFKQSGALYLYLGVVLVFVCRDGLHPDCGPLFSRSAARALARRILKAAAIIVIALVLYRVVIPARIETGGQEFTSRWTMSLREVSEFPLLEWKENIEGVGSYFTHYYTVAVFPLLLGFIVRAAVRRERSDLVISALLLLSTLAVVLGMKKYSEAIYNTATVIFTLIAIGRLLALALRRTATGPLKKAPLAALCTCLLIVVMGGWLYQVILLRLSAVSYVERGSRWMRSNYLEGWPGSFGINRVIEFLQEQPPKSIAFVDPQWGTPGTSLQVLSRLYPRVRIVPFGREMYDPHLKARLDSAGFSRRFVIYKPWGEPQRRAMESYIDENLCAKRIEYRESEDQIPIVVCRF